MDSLKNLTEVIESISSFVAALAALFTSLGITYFIESRKNKQSKSAVAESLIDAFSKKSRFMVSHYFKEYTGITERYEIISLLLSKSDPFLSCRIYLRGYELCNWNNGHFIIKNPFLTTVYRIGYIVLEVLFILLALCSFIIFYLRLNQDMSIRNIAYCILYYLVTLFFVLFFVFAYKKTVDIAYAKKLCKIHLDN
jgi:hypothetical protein